MMNHPSSSIRTALIFLLVAAVGGFYMFFRDIKGKMSPVWLAFVHAALAVTGVVFLLIMVI
jgi:hypothetical protein